jgi:hypothetical protein
MTRPSDSAEPVRTPPFVSRDCIDIVVDIPGDNEVRPIPPSRRAQAIAEREKILRWSKQGPTPPPRENGH